MTIIIDHNDDPKKLEHEWKKIGKVMEKYCHVTRTGQPTKMLLADPIKKIEFERMENETWRVTAVTGNTGVVFNSATDMSKEKAFVRVFNQLKKEERLPDHTPYAGRKGKYED